MRVFGFEKCKSIISAIDFRKIRLKIGSGLDIGIPGTYVPRMETEAPITCFATSYILCSMYSTYIHILAIRHSGCLSKTRITKMWRKKEKKKFTGRKHTWAHIDYFQRIQIEKTLFRWEYLFRFFRTRHVFCPFYYAEHGKTGKRKNGKMIERYTQFIWRYHSFSTGPLCLHTYYFSSMVSRACCVFLHTMPAPPLAS